MIAYIYYHRADLDGYAGGYLLKGHLLNTAARKNKHGRHVVDNGASPAADVSPGGCYIRTRPYNYDDKLDDDIAQIGKFINAGRHVTVYFVDCCPHQEGAYFEKLHGLLSERLVIIDHHKTALEYLREYEDKRRVKISGNSSDKYAGCELAAMYILREEASPGDDVSEEAVYKKVNRCVKLIGIYDSHRVNDGEFSWEREVMPFQYWMRTQCPDLRDIITENAVLEDMLGGTFFASPGGYGEALLKGEAILAYIKTRNMNIFRNNSHLSRVTFSGTAVCLKALWAADYLNNSVLFSDNDAYNDPDLVYMLIVPDIYDGIFRISLYSTEESSIDVGNIAKTVSGGKGGGHFHAAGFKASSVIINKMLTPEKDGIESKVTIIAQQL
jgi:hypothetical protein